MVACTSESLRVSLPILLFLFVVVGEWATAYCGSINEDFAIGCILRVK